MGQDREGRRMDLGAKRRIGRSEAECLIVEDKFRMTPNFPLLLEPVPSGQPLA